MPMPVRRIIAGVDDRGISSVLRDGPAPDVRLDPARPGFALTRVWVTDSTPAKVKGVRETLDKPISLQPAPGGTILYCVELPPGESKASAADAKAWFSAMGSPGVQVAGPHPYMQKTNSLDFCYVLDGAATLVLETGEVELREGDTVINRGGAHAWTNRSGKPCRVLISAHYGVRDKGTTTQPPDPATEAPAPARRLRRVVVGHDSAGRSRVEFDGANPNTLTRATGSIFNELWTIETMPAPLESPHDFGGRGRTFAISPPDAGAHWRITMSPAQEPDPKKAHGEEKKKLESAHSNDGAATERRADGRHWGMHRTPTVDYAICLDGKRDLVLEEYNVTLGKGDVVIQLGNWHSWANLPDSPGMMSYIMIGGELG